MKINSIVLSAIFFVTTLGSCKKESETPNEHEPRLYEVVSTMPLGIYHHNFQYNDDGKITKITGHYDNDAPITLYNVSYSNNKILLVAPGGANPNFHIEDSVTLILDANNKLLKRLSRSFFHGGTSPAYKYDTITYEYDGSGMLLKEIENRQDSSAIDPINTINYHYSNVYTYTRSNGNLSNKNIAYNYVVTSRSPDVVRVERYTAALNLNYQYVYPFPNKKDLTNAILLNELILFEDFPYNDPSPLLPSNSTWDFKEKDESGHVMAFGSGTPQFQYSFDSDGLLSSWQKEAVQNSRKTFIYK